MEDDTLVRGQRQLEGGLVFVAQELLAEGGPERPIIHSNGQDPQVSGDVPLQASMKVEDVV